ncbi:MmcQ/YjbR family DNA-binding protein [Acetobacteraceae bacterium ESL0709]|nr:MmcQ/YjbR family DNA-binding protein [Acetobacteraceae bacterium ESL0697]MDF7677542.1 MmcQ/YjbR family DNA-binding protein [Acetobacteraceae bacterium ESL0709]
MKRDTLLDYVRREFGAEPEYLWPRFPSYAVLRHHGRGKWFAIIMKVSGATLGLKMKDDVEIVNVKAKPAHIVFLLQKEGIFPAYHMNKNHWISVRLDGPLSSKEICGLLADSYGLTS